MITIIVIMALVILALAFHCFCLTAYSAGLTRAAENLYMVTRWRSTDPRLSEHVEAELWMHLRDALMLEPGTATVRGVGDPNA